VGWHGMLNSGDDAMLWKILEWCDTTFPGAEIQVFGRRQEFPDAIANPLISRPAFRGILGSKLKRYYFQFWNPKSTLWKMSPLLNVVIFGGGNIFHSKSSVSWKASLLSAIERKTGNRPLTIALGVGFGPFSSETDRQASASLVQKIDLLYLRDKYSYEFALEQGSPESVVFGPDLTVCLPGRLGAASLEGLWAEDESTLVALNGSAHRSRRVSASIENSLLSSFCHSTRYGVLVTCGDKKFGDWKTSMRLFGKMKKLGLNVELHNYDPDPLAMMSIVGSYRTLLSERLHPLVYGLRTPTTLLQLGARKEKFSNVLAALDTSERPVGTKYLPMILHERGIGFDHEEIRTEGELALAKVGALAKTLLSEKRPTP